MPYPSNVAAPQVCQMDGRPPAQPSLAEMTTKAIELLDRPASDSGFLLQVEGASIDKQNHVANPCGQIGETVAFDRAIQVGLAFAAAHPDTLLIVTGDHAHTSQIVATPNDLEHPPGLISTLLTREGAPMTVSYGTNVAPGNQEHTGTQIRIAATGPLAANVVGTLDQTDLFRLMERAIVGRSRGAAAASHAR